MIIPIRGVSVPSRVQIAPTAPTHFLLALSRLLWLINIKPPRVLLNVPLVPVVAMGISKKIRRIVSKRKYLIYYLVAGLIICCAGCLSAAVAVGVQ